MADWGGSGIILCLPVVIRPPPTFGDEVLDWQDVTHHYSGPALGSWSWPSSSASPLGVRTVYWLDPARRKSRPFRGWNILWRDCLISSKHQFVLLEDFISTNLTAFAKNKSYETNNIAYTKVKYEQLEHVLRASFLSPLSKIVLNLFTTEILTV